MAVSDIFSNGERGFWYDLDDLTTLFQDTSGTIPVTGAGQTIALILDKSGNGNHMTVGRTATLELDTNNHYYLDTTDGSLSTGLPYPLEPNVVSAIAINRLSISSATIVHSLAANSGANDYFQFFLQTSERMQTRHRALSAGYDIKTTSVSAVGSVPLNTPTAHLAFNNSTPGNNEQYVNYSSAYTVASNQPSGLQLGTVTTYSTGSNHLWYGSLVVWRAVTSTERSDIIDFHYAKTQYRDIASEITKTQDSVSRIAISSSKTTYSKSRISKSFTKTELGRARLQKQFTSAQASAASITTFVLSTDVIDITFVDGIIYEVDQTSIARIVEDIELSQDSVARITKIVSLQQTGQGRIQKIFTLLQNAVSRIITTPNLTQNAVARLVNTLSILQDSIARIQKDFSLSQDSGSRISKTLSEVQTADARLIREVTKTQPAIASILWILSKSQTAIARISKSLLLANTSRGRIEKQFSKTILGRAWLGFWASLDQDSIATIQKILIHEQTSMSYIGTAYTPPVISQDNTYSPTDVPDGDYGDVTVKADNTYGVGKIPKGEFSKVIINSNNIYEVVEHDGI